MHQAAIDDTLQAAQVEIDLHPMQVNIGTSMGEVLAQMGLWEDCASQEVGSAPRRGYVLVMDAGQLVGIFTEWDVLRLTIQGAALSTLKIEDCMSHDVVTLEIHNIHRPLVVLALLRQHGVSHLPVLGEEGQIVGVAIAEKLYQSVRSQDFLRLRRVAEVMRPVITATAETPVMRLVERMIERQMGCVVIVAQGSGQHPVGIVTERDIVQKRNLPFDLEQLTAAAVMRMLPEKVTLEQSLWDVKQAMERLRVRHLVVATDDDHLAGIVTQADILDRLAPAEMYSMIEQLQTEIAQLKAERLGLLQQPDGNVQASITEQRFQEIFNNTFQFTGLMTLDGTLIEANQAALEFGGTTRDQVLNRPVWETYWWTISPETQEQLRQATARAAQGEFVRYEVEVLGAGGIVVPIDFSLRPLRDEQGNVVLLIPEGRDITELKQAQQALEFQVKFDRLVASLSNQFVQINPDALDEAITAALRSIGEFTQVDTCFIFRYDSHQPLHSMTHEWVSPNVEASQPRCQDLPLAMFPWATAQLQRGEIVQIADIETLPPTAATDQQSFQQFGLRSSLSLPLKQHDRVIGMVGFACFQQLRNWTDDNVQLLKSFADVLANALQRQQADIDLHRSYQRYNNLVNRVPVGVYKFCMKVDGGVQFEYVSARWCEMNQLDATAVLQDASLAFGEIHPDELDHFQQLNQQARLTLKPFVWEGRMVVGGQVYWRHIESSPTQRDNGDIAWDGIQYDITEAVEAKQAQERSLAEAIAARVEATNARDVLAQVFTRMNDGIVALDREWRYTYVNDKAAAMFGRTADDLIGKHIWAEFPDGIGQPFYQAYYRAVEQQTVIYLEEYYEPWDRWFENRIYPDANGLTIYFTEITDRKLGEIAVQQSEQRYASLAAAAPVGIFRTDAIGNCQYVNDRWSQIAGLSYEAAQGNGWVNGLHPEDRDFVGAEWNRAAQENRPFRLEYRFQRPDGTVSWVFGQAMSEQDAQGQITGYVGTITDITDRKTVEEALKRQRDFNQLIAEITSRFVDLEGTALDTEIDRSLRLIGEMTAVDTSYLFQWDADGPTMSMTHEWGRPGQPRQLILAQKIPLAAFPWSIAQLNQRQPLYVPSVAELPIDAAIDQASWQPFKVIGILGVPLIQKSAVVGFMGFGSFSQTMHWDAETIRLLQVLAQTIANAQVRAQDERQLYESEERLRLALTAANQGLYDVNLRTRDAIVSPAYATMLGYDPDTFQETNDRWIERLHPDDRESVGQVFRDYIAGLIPDYKVEFRQLTRSGDWKWILSLGKIVAWDAEGSPLRMLGTHTDISDRKLAELRLTLQNSVLARIAKADPLPEILDTLVRGSEIQMGSGICSILLCDREGRVHYGAAPHLPDAYNQAIEGGVIGEAAGSCGTAAFRGEMVIVEDIETDPLWKDYAALALAYGLRACWSTPVLDSDGTVLATFAVYHREVHSPEQWEIDVIQRIADLTKIAIEAEQARHTLQQLNQDLEAKVIERTAALQESEAQLRDLFDNATDLIQSVAPDGRILFVNQAWKATLGFEEPEIKDLSIFQIIHPDELEHCRLVMQRLFEGKECEGIETRFVTKAGQEVILEGNVNCRHQDGQAVSTRGIFRNVTERRQAEVQLKRQLAAIEAAVDGIAILQGDQYIYVNSSHLSLFGHSCSEDLIGKSWQCLYGPEEILRFEHEVFPVLGASRHWEGEATAIRKDGTTFAEGLSLTLSEDGLLICVCRDITERKQAEERLRKSDAHLKSAQRIANLGSWEFDVQKELLTWSEEVFSIFGLDPSMGPPANFEALQQYFHPEDREPHAETVQTTLTTGQPYDREFRIGRPNGALVYIQVKGEVILDAAGQPYQMLGTILDITARKLADQKMQETVTQLATSNRELESFSYSVSHDLRAPLRHIHGFVNALRLKLEGHHVLTDPKVMQYLEVIETSSQKMGSLIDGLLTLSRIGRKPIVSKPLSLRKLVDEAIALVQGSSDITNPVEFVIGQLPTVEGDSTLLQQVLSNLIGNAVKFSRNTPHPIVEINATAEGVIFVRDNGVGLDMKYADKLFGAFQRLHTESEFEGTGIGLAIVQRIIHRHGGSIWVESQLNYGTTFFFTVGFLNLNYSTEVN